MRWPTSNGALSGAVSVAGAGAPKRMPGSGNAVEVSYGRLELVAELKAFAAAHAESGVRPFAVVCGSRAFRAAVFRAAADGPEVHLDLCSTVWQA